MKRELFLSLKVKLGLLVASIVLVIMMIVAYTTIIRQKTVMEREMRPKAINMAQITGALTLIGGNASDPWAFARRFLKYTPQLDENILYVVIVDRSDRVAVAEINKKLLKRLAGNKYDVLTASIPALVQARITNAPETPSYVELADELGHILSINVVLRPEDRFIGNMSIGYSLYRFDESVADAKRATLLLTLVFILAGTLASFGLSLSITRPVYKIVHAMKRVQQGDLDQRVTINTKDEMQMLASSFNFMVEGLKEREHIKQTFKRYVSGPVVEQLIREKGVSITGERKTATIMFQDIRGFTSMSERMPPEEVVGILKEYFTAMVDVIFSYEGTLDKYIGDAIMAVFGTPYAHHDDPLRAVSTAIDMQMALKTLNEGWRKDGMSRHLEVGCGIATGPVVVGSVGSEKRLEYTAIGDTVNLASRIEGQTRGGQILICERTYDAVKDYIGVNALDKVYLKGKKEPQQIYEVVYET